eukprot:PhM_4_TR2799/c0_g1_i1/m.22137
MRVLRSPRLRRTHRRLTHSITNDPPPRSSARPPCCRCCRTPHRAPQQNSTTQKNNSDSHPDEALVPLHSTKPSGYQQFRIARRNDEYAHLITKEMTARYEPLVSLDAYHQNSTFESYALGSRTVNATMTSSSGNVNNTFYSINGNNSNNNATVVSLLSASALHPSQLQHQQHKNKSPLAKMLASTTIRPSIVPSSSPSMSLSSISGAGNNSKTAAARRRSRTLSPVRVSVERTVRDILRTEDKRSKHMRQVEWSLRPSARLEMKAPEDPNDLVKRVGGAGLIPPFGRKKK